MIEQEIKLAFEHVEAARRAVSAAGGRLVASRRLLDDRLFDAADARLRRAGQALRVRRDADRTYLTFKGPILPGPVKTREELEMLVGDASMAEAVLASLGFRQIFRSEKYREDYLVRTAQVTIDESPVGVFIEVEGSLEEIEVVTLLLGRTPRDFCLESYAAIWRRWCTDRGIPPGDMIFDQHISAR